MTLPIHEDEMRRWAEFAVSRWKYDRDIRLVCFEAMCLGMKMTQEDFFKIVKIYVSTQNEISKMGGDA